MHRARRYSLFGQRALRPFAARPYLRRFLWFLWVAALPWVAAGCGLPQHALADVADSEWRPVGPVARAAAPDGDKPLPPPPMPGNVAASKPPVPNSLPQTRVEPKPRATTKPIVI